MKIQFFFLVIFHFSHCLKLINNISLTSLSKSSNKGEVCNPIHEIKLQRKLYYRENARDTKRYLLSRFHGNSYIIAEIS